ncbi:TIGR03364 family FAD-dependent oxidoreductase [Ammonicoccus fulvus]|uniref:TIGR03364 family FAD-dependent oxidoreductase n=1 Tax=Ammonicoccus fulvus TaxID=3138240 RepID=A0ABZ3FNH6_9ACTN
MDTDLVIVGAGIIGLSHAVAAVRRGLRVRIVERDSRAVGASVRNFGHCCLTAQPDELVELAQSSREHWLKIAADADLAAQEAGAYVVARGGAELGLLEEFAAQRSGVELKTGSEMAAVLTGGERDPAGLIGGAYFPGDLRVDPRTTAARIAAWLQAQGVRIDWRTACLGVGDGVVHTTRGHIRAEHALVCVGHDVDQLLPEVADAAGLVRCALQMALVDGPAGFTSHAAVLTATSMLRYGGMAAMPSAAEVRCLLRESSPELLEMVANVMCAARPDGTLLVGDSHAYDLSHEPFLDEQISARLLAEIAAVFGVPELRVRQRWQGVYASCPDRDLLIEQLDPRTTVVSVTSGVGMTLSFGLGEQTLAGL